MQSFDALQQRISRAIEELNLPPVPKELYDPIEYTLQLGGKRLRPLLLLAACDMFDGQLEEAINPAIGIELFHNFTLLHDDLMDQAPLRRNKETVYKKWNANIAILAGDTMFALANRSMLKTRIEVITELLDLFNLTAIEVCEGQQFDMNFESLENVSISEYLEMIRLKTAVLLAASLKSGAMIAGASSVQAEMIYKFGINIGVAFQLMDDLLDVYGSEEKFGKMNGGDIIAGKKTYLYLKALELSGNKTELSNLYNAKDLVATDKINKVKACFDQLDILSVTRKEISGYWEMALSNMKSLDLKDKKTHQLMTFCASLMEREY
jgi:geranylgeranyl diphosphate synthase, type II